MSRWSSSFFFPVASSEKRRPHCLHWTVRFRKSSSKSGLYLKSRSQISHITPGMASATYLAIPDVESSILWERSLRACSETLLLGESVDSGCGSFTSLEATGGVPVAPTTPAFTRALYKFAISLTAGKAGTLDWLVDGRGAPETGCTGGAGGKDGFTSRVP